MGRSNGPGHYGNSDTKVRRLFLLALENVKREKGKLKIVIIIIVYSEHTQTVRKLGRFIEVPILQSHRDMAEVPTLAD